ncbi:tetratricopeptide repeat protein [Geomonas edaphica]|uniref:tetratricopeptide repeat protein n=1 Tax=Geomonas edaphica TaxID=2570226 RepID=UPI0010A92EAE|nr:hypothetical protein [Geomonas edaphica]
MTWELHVAEAENLLSSSRLPSSTELISLIKRVNPTRLQLHDEDRKRGYRLKNALQNLLLENYGEAFHLAPHPCAPDIVLIKHNTLPSIDACHAVMGVFSENALRTVAVPEAKPQTKSPRKDKVTAETPASPMDVVRQAQRLLDEFDYSQAERLLCDIRIENNRHLPALLRAATMLLQDMGAYTAAIRTLLAQPRAVLRDTAVRELIALAYHRNGMPQEARALFDGLHAVDLGKNALCAYADISFKDGNLAHAWHLLKEADEKEGFIVEHAALMSSVETAMRREAQPWVQRAEEALTLNDMEQAEAQSREALGRCPSLQRPREIIAMAAAKREAEKLAALWRRLEMSEPGPKRLELLETLQEHDTKAQERIAGLIAAEKAAIKRYQVESKLETLRKEAETRKWQECYDIIEWLSRQDDHSEAYREACGVSPYFSVLHQNRRLQKVSGKSAREAWLRFVEAKSAFETGKLEGCFEIMEEIRDYFGHCPEFAEPYRMMLEREQEAARSEIALLLEQAQSEHADAVRIGTIFNRIRKRMSVLPEEERNAHLKTMRERQSLLETEPDGDELVSAYAVCRLFGNLQRASLLREHIADETSLKKVEDEVGELFKIERSGLTLNFSNDMPVDLTSEPALAYRGSTDRHIFLTGMKYFILVDLHEMSATRFDSIYLTGGHLVDALPAKGIFLFRGITETNYVVRAELTASKWAITALFDVSEAFLLEEGATVVDIYLSSDRETDYYLNIKYEDGSRPGKMGRMRVRSRNGMADTVQIKDEPVIYSKRLSSAPDRFIIGATDETRICTRNLTYDFIMGMTPDIWEVDEENRHIYYFYSHILKRVDFKFDDYTEFPESPGCFFFKMNHRILGVSPTTNTVMIAFKQKAALYDFGTNELSVPFPFSAIVSTRPARKWYCFDYSEERRELTLKDVTREVRSLLAWKPLPLGGGRKRTAEEVQEAYGMLYFGYTCEDPPEDAEGETGACDEAS